MNWLLSDVLPGRQRISRLFPAKSTGIVKHSPILDNFSCTCTSKSFHQKSIRCADKRSLLLYNTKNNHSLCELFKPTPNNISYLSSEACFTPPSVPSFFMFITLSGVTSTFHWKPWVRPNHRWSNLLRKFGIFEHVKKMNLLVFPWIRVVWLFVVLALFISCHDHVSSAKFQSSPGILLYFFWTYPKL